MEELLGFEHLKLPLNKVMLIFQGIRTGYRLLHYGDIYSNRENFLELASGHVINYAFGDLRCVQIAAQCVLISKQLVECIERQKKVNRAFMKMLDHVKGSYPSCSELAANVQTRTYKWLSPATAHQIHSSFYKINHFLSTLVLRIYKLAKSIFFLCLTIADTVDSFSLSPMQQRAAACHLFLNLSQQLASIANNAEELLQQLHNNHEVIDKMFLKIGSTYSSEHLIASLSPIANTLSAVNARMNSLRPLNNTFVHILQESIFGFMAVLGLQNLLPDSWIPPLVYPLLSNASQVYGRFPPPNMLLWKRKLSVIPQASSIRRVSTLVKRLQNT